MKKSKAKYCEYLTCKIYHYIRIAYDIRLKVFVAIFKENEVSDFELNNIEIYDLVEDTTQIKISTIHA